MARGLVFFLFSTFILVGCEHPDVIYSNPPDRLITKIESLMPAAEEFVNENEKIALENGIPLTQEQLKIAESVGLKNPERVRVLYTDRLPKPQDPDLAEVAKKFNYDSPMIVGYTYGYGVWIKSSEKSNMRLLSHELVHVRQAEEMGKKDQIRQYLLQLYIYGYRASPLEREAYREESNHI